MTPAAPGVVISRRAANYGHRFLGGRVAAPSRRGWAADEAGTASQDVDRPIENPVGGKKLGEFIAVGLYLGQPGELMASWPNRPSTSTRRIAAAHSTGKFSGSGLVSAGAPVRLPLRNLDW
jgi:hypothetical protein